MLVLITIKDGKGRVQLSAEEEGNGSKAPSLSICQSGSFSSGVIFLEINSMILKVAYNGFFN